MDASDLLAIETLLFTNRIRAIQEDFPSAHRELVNWGAWSRHLVGLKPHPARPSWCRDYETKDWNEEDGVRVDEEIAKRREAEPEVRAESGDRPLYRERPAYNLDVFLHATFPWRDRRCLSVAYFWCFPEYQYAVRASKGLDIIDRDEYLSIFARAFRCIEGFRV